MLSGQIQHAEARVNSLQFTCRLRKHFFPMGSGLFFFLRWDYFATPCSEHDLVIDLIISFLEKPLYTFPSQFAGGENARKK